MSGDYLADSPEHRFEPQDRLPDRCGFVSDGMTCGYGRECHEALWPSEPTASEPGDLAAFIAARYDEAEALAKAAAADGTPGWHLRDEPDPVIGESRIYDANGLVVVYDEGAPSPNEAKFIVSVDPKHRLADIKLKRAILAEHRPAEPPKYGQDVPRCAACLTSRGGWQEDWSADPWPCATVRQLATEYAEHAAYQAGWAP